MRIFNTPIDARPDGLMENMPEGSRHWKVRLTHGGRQMTIYYTQGPAVAGEPKLMDVVGCLSMDVIEDYASFEDWAADLGYDTNSRKVERIYEACLKQSTAFKRLCGGDYGYWIEKGRAA